VKRQKKGSEGKSVSKKNCKLGGWLNAFGGIIYQVREREGREGRGRKTGQRGAVGGGKKKRILSRENRDLNCEKNF